jgi:hypothetical protein
MKLPFDLSLKFVFRLLLPGLVVALALLPLMETALLVLHIRIAKEAVFIGLALVCGWLVLMLDMPIYMLYEGRRFWPRWLRRVLVQQEQKYLDRRLEIDRRYQQKDARILYEDYQEAWVDIRQFPIDESGKPIACFPTRMGNLIAAYEDYPNSRYGLDAIFFWSRIWVKLDKDLREDIDSSQALADSTLYTSFASSLLGVIFLVYTLLKMFGITGIRGVDQASFWSLIVITLAGFAAGYLLYRLGLHSQAAYGEWFKAMFDIYHSDLDFSPVLKRVGAITGEDEPVPPQEQAKKAWLYLQYYRVKPRGVPRSIPVPEYLAQKKQQGIPADAGDPPPPTGEESTNT